MTIQKLNIPAGTALMIGAPSRPMDEQISIAIGKLTESIDGILEAHLPQMLAISVMDQPAQVLVIVLQQDAAVNHVANQLGIGLAKILPEDKHLDVWHIKASHPMLDDVRRAGCQI